MFDLNITFALELVIFFLVVLFCRFQIYPPLDALIKERQSKISKNLADIENSEKTLKKAATQAENIIKEAKTQSRSIMNETRIASIKMQDTLKSQALKDNEIAYKSMVEKAAKEVSRNSKMSSKELLAQATAIASKILGKVITQEDQERIIEKMLNEID